MGLPYKVIYSLQKDKERESRRRREGQELGQWKKDQEERERQHWLNERRKQKLEGQRARQEILAKLEQDKQERLALKKQKLSGINNIYSNKALDIIEYIPLATAD